MRFNAAIRMFRDCLTLASFLVIPALSASAQTSSPPGPGSPALPSTAASPPVEGGSGWVLAAILITALLAITIGIAKVVDLRRKLEAENLQLQAQLSEALLRDRTLGGFPIVPTVHTPGWKRSPVTIEVSGSVPTPALRQAALRVIQEQASRFRSDFEIEDRLAVASTATDRAA